MPSPKLRPFTAAGTRHYPGRPLVEAPDPPSWMRPIARDKYSETVEYLVDLGAITAAELPLVEVFAVSYGHWREAEQMLAGSELTHRAVKNRAGDECSPVALPAAAQAAKAFDMMRRAAASLGLAPVERGRLPASTPSSADDPAERLFEQVAKQDADRAARRLA